MDQWRCKDKCFHTHQPSLLCCAQLSAGASARRQPWERFTFIPRELWDRSSGWEGEAEGQPARKVRPLQGRAGQGQRSSSWERGRHGWRQKGLLLLQLPLPMPALLHLLARTMRSFPYRSCLLVTSSSCDSTSPGSLHGLNSPATRARGGKSRAFPRQRENNPFS